MTRGDVLRYAIAFALRRARKIVRGLKEGLTEAEGFAVVGHVVSQLQDGGDPWGLSEEAQPKARADYLIRRGAFPMVIAPNIGEADEPKTRVPRMEPDVWIRVFIAASLPP
jgi:hypothetical protein